MPSVISWYPHWIPWNPITDHKVGWESARFCGVGGAIPGCREGGKANCKGLCQGCAKDMGWFQIGEFLADLTMKNKDLVGFRI